MRADDVNAEDFVVFLFGDDLDKTIGFAEDACLAGGRKWELADLYIVTLLFCFCFGQADRCDFRVALGAVGDKVLFDRHDLFAGEFFDDHDAFF